MYRRTALFASALTTLAACSDAEDACLAEAYPASSALEPGPTSTGLYDTVTPFEHADSARTHTYVADFGGSMTDPTANRVTARSYEGVHESPYNIVTRDRDEVFVFGGTQGERETALGPFVAKLDAVTREVVWRTDLRDTKALGEFLWPGLVTAHGNGDLYAIYGARLARLDPEDGSIKTEIELPVPTGLDPADTNFNGFTVLASGLLVTKSFGRPDGCELQGVDALQDCVTDETPLPPSIVHVIDPEAMTILDSIELDESAGGRLTSVVFEGQQYVYVPGDVTIFRFTVDDAGKLTRDETWEVVDYLKPGQSPASAPVILKDWVVFQTNANFATAPLSVLAISQADASVQLTIDPFGPGDLPLSAVPSALTVDPDNDRIYPMDTARGQVGCVEIVDGERLEMCWVVDQTTLNHTSLVGPPDARVFVSTETEGLLEAVLGSANTYDEWVVWRDAATGEELARSDKLPPMLPGDPLAPGFFGVWFYPQADGTLVELEVEGPELAACREEAG